MSLSSETLQKIKQQLHASSHDQGAVASDLYSHLTEVFSRIVQYHQYDAFDKFEEISTLVKRTHMNFSDPKRDAALNMKAAGASKDAQERNAWIQASRDLLNEVYQGMQRQQCIKASLPNLDEEADMLEWAGVSFGQDFTYKLSKSLKKLAAMSGASKLNLFGKIYGTKMDYWVVSGVLGHVEEPNADSSVEKRGQGVNAMVYWVTDNILNDWIQLPECKPEYIVAARMIKHVMTGDLNANIDSNPPFPGKERHFLRAQIARIHHATDLAPKGYWTMDEEVTPPVMKQDEEFALPPTEELNNLELWANTYAEINQGGRTAHAAPDNLNEEDREAFLAEMNEKEPPTERFRILQEQTPMPGLEFAWVKKIVGDQQQYNSAKEGGNATTYAVNVLKSLRWPGAITVQKCGKFCSIYVGDGLKVGAQSMSPTEPPEVQRDPEDETEMPEPTPIDQPEEPPEPDTDKVDKDDDDDDN